jgi:hypothetical protein
MIADLDRNLSIDVSRRSRRLSVSIAAIVAIAIGGAVFGYSRWSVSQRRDEPPPNQPIHSNSAEPGGKTDENVERLPNFTMDPALRPGTPEMERAVAQWVIDCGGVVLVRPKVYNQLIKEKSSQLLNGDVRVTGISFSGRPVRDADLEPLVLLTALEILYLDGTQVGDKGVVQTLSGLTSLKYLSLERTAVTDASLSYLSRMIELHLRGTQTTSDGVARLAATNRSARILSGALPPPAYADMALREPNRK